MLVPTFVLPPCSLIGLQPSSFSALHAGLGLTDSTLSTAQTLSPALRRGSVTHCYKGTPLIQYTNYTQATGEHEYSTGRSFFLGRMASGSQAINLREQAAASMSNRNLALLSRLQLKLRVLIMDDGWKMIPSRRRQDPCRNCNRRRCTYPAHSIKRTFLRRLHDLERQRQPLGHTTTTSAPMDTTVLALNTLFSYLSLLTHALSLYLLYDCSATSPL